MLVPLSNRRPAVLMFIQLIMDVDLILPLLKAAKQRNDIFPVACLSDLVTAQMPSLEASLTSLDVEFEIVEAGKVIEGELPGLENVAALISASESTANPHRAAHRLTKRANDAGIATYTLQHGLENIGLTYFDSVHRVQDILFASDIVFTWGPLQALHDDVPPETRNKCVPVGYCKELVTDFHAVAKPGGRQYLVTVFENLHWHRYDSNYSSDFLTDLVQTAEFFPDTTFIVKPHPAGKWITHRHTGALPEANNILIAHPDDPEWKPYSGPVLVAISDGVITTPSTVALDAAHAYRPVAVIGYNLNLPVYYPLPILRSTSDWSAFVEQLHLDGEKHDLEHRAASFLSNVILPGDACGRILDTIRTNALGRFK